MSGNLLQRYRCGECGTLNIPPEGIKQENKYFCDPKCYRQWYRTKRNRWLQ